MSAERAGASSLDALRRRLAELPAALSEAAALPLPEAAPRSVVTTGIGGSEGPARLLAGALARAGRCCARFVPLAAFHAGTEPEADLLVVFSQGLSPNAGLALQSARAERRWVLTSVGHGDTDAPRRATLDALEREGVRILRMPPGVERGMLARVVGPQVASLLALRLAAALGAAELTSLPFEAAARAWPSPIDPPVLPAHRVALVTDAASSEWAFGLRWKLLEGLLLPDPPAWDALQLAHGPLQSFYDHSMTLVVLETPASGDLLARLAEVTSPDRHRIVRVPAGRADPLGYFEHAAAIDAMVLRTLEARPRDLADWPARGRDGALYGIRAPLGSEPPAPPKGHPAGS